MSCCARCVRFISVYCHCFPSCLLIICLPTFAYLAFVLSCPQIVLYIRHARLSFRVAFWIALCKIPSGCMSGFLTELRLVKVTDNEAWVKTNQYCPGLTLLVCFFVCVCVCVCWGVYLAGDLEVLRVEDKEALRELQQLPWRCELLLGVSAGDLMDDNKWTNTHHTHAYIYTHKAMCMYAYITGTHMPQRAQQCISRYVKQLMHTFNIYSNQDRVQCMVWKLSELTHNAQETHSVVCSH